jgi:hypothetical protein
MIRDIRQLLSTRPFQPFSIVTSAGKQYRVPTSEHAGVNPTGSRVVVWFGDGSGVTISALHISAVEQEQSAK